MPNWDLAHSSRLVVFTLWVLSGFALLALLGSLPLMRTQEARVLETARQMLESDDGVRAWVVPTLNGEPRLKKPPLAYWMAAVAFSWGGVSEAVGRIPTAVIGWLTLGALFVFVSHLFDQRTGLASAATLLASHLFFRHMRLAETDAPATLFITMAVGSLWRSARDSRARWMHLAAASTALAVLSKGAPAVFVLVFLLALCAIEDRWDLLLRLFRTGAILTFIAIAAPWFIYIQATEGGGHVLASEVVGSLSGVNHWRWPSVYLFGLFVAVAPWSAFLPIAVVDAIRRWPNDAGVRVTLIWFGAVLVPLCVNGNKQPHYLLMLMPPTMVLIGRILVATSPGLARANRFALLGTVAAFALGGVGIVAAGHFERGHILPLDWALGIAVVAGTLAIAVAWRRCGIGLAICSTAAGTAILLPILLSVWYATLVQEPAGLVAEEVKQRFPSRQYLFYGKARSLKLCFDLRAEIPSARNPAELRTLSRQGAILIAQSKVGVGTLPVPAQFVHQFRIANDEQSYDVYELVTAISPPTPEAAARQLSSSIECEID